MSNQHDRNVCARSRRRLLAGLSIGAAAAALPSLLKAQEAPRLRIAVGFGLPNFPVRIAQQQNFFVAHAAKLGIPNLKVELIQLSGQNPIIDALLSNQIDICISGPAGMLIAWDKTRGTRREICGISGLSTNQCTLLTVDPRIKSLADFGAADKIAMPSTANTQAFLLKMACAKQFDDPHRLDKNMVSLPHPDAVNGLLRGGIVSAHFASPPYAQIVQTDPRARKLLTSTEVFGGKSSFVIAAGMRSLATTHPQLIEIFHLGIQDALNLIKETPAKATSMFLAMEPSKILPASGFQRILEDPMEGYSMNTMGIVTYAQFMKQIGVLKTNLTNANDFLVPAAHGFGNT